MRRLLLAMLLLFVSSAAWAVPPHAISVVLDALKDLPRVEVTASEHEAKPVKYSGVSLQSLMARRFYAPEGDRLRGPWLAAVVRATGADGYQVVFTLAELDAAFGGLQVLVADTADGVPLSADDGPVRLVVPSDKRAARWLRQLVKLEILELKE
jgi:hypothetical protein